MVEDQNQQKTSKFYNILLVGILCTGLLFVYGPQLGLLITQGEVEAADAFTYVADLDFWHRTEREKIVTATARFDLDNDLNDVPLTFGDWTGENYPQENEEVMILLDPEQYILRLYQNSAGQFMWLSMIGGRSSKPFHAPDICYDADGWQYNLGSKAVSLEGGGEVHGLWLEATKTFPDQEEPVDQIVYYFYLFPDGDRDLSEGIVLFKLTSPRYGSTEETLAVHADFVQNLFTSAQ